ncbi:MAG: YbhB/YbcL family Raf kinase inhibitor-like protein [Candidatus Binatia bacterium]
MKPISTLFVVLTAGVLVAASSSPESAAPETSEVVTGTDGGEFTATSKDFGEGAKIPVEHTCDGADRSPSLAWSGAPEGSKAFAIVMQDSDAPKGTFTHWTAWNIPEGARALDRGVPVKAKLGDGTIQGKNDFGRVGYAGPCPPKGSAHTYVFRVFALKAALEIEEDSGPDTVLEAAKKQSLADAKLESTYARTAQAETETDEQ